MTSPAPAAIVSRRPVALAAFLISFAVYLVTAAWHLPSSIDPLTNGLTAWVIGNHGTPVLDEFEPLGEPHGTQPRLAWVVPSDRGPVSQYPPGAALWAAPFTLLTGNDGLVTRDIGADQTTYALPPTWPSALAAALAAAIAVTAVTAVAVDLGATTRQAAGVAATIGLGTGVWSVAADGLWQHGPAAMWLALGLLAVQRGRARWSGAAFAWAVLTRPHTAAVGAAVAIGEWIGRRRVAAVTIAGGVAVGLVALLAYNTWLFGTPSVSGGYGDGFADMARSAGIGWYVANLGAALFHPRYGLLVWSPFVVVLAFGARAGWLAAPHHVRSAALGALVYLLVQYRANRASGGDAFLFYRYPIEALVAAAPLGFLAFRERIARHPVLSRAFAVTVVFSISAHAVAAVV